MTVLKIELVDPRVRALLDDLVKLNLIRIQEEQNPQKKFTQLLEKLRSKESEAPDPETIAREVDAVRTQG
jgi:hypothetical protein